MTVFLCRPMPSARVIDSGRGGGSKCGALKLDWAPPVERRSRVDVLHTVGLGPPLTRDQVRLRLAGPRSLRRPWICALYAVHMHSTDTSCRAW